tara:strand:- start:6861 stop:7856 length:996 start_codon:yes stop_codon:yes gene_type:complete
MRLINIHEVGNKEFNELVFCYSTIASLIVFIIFFALLLTCVGHYVWYSISFSVELWGKLVYLWFAFWFGFISCLAWSRYRAGLLVSNWLMRSSPSRTLIKFRSFQNHNYPESDLVVIELYWREVKWLRMTKETSHKPGSDSTVTEFFTYLDMKLNLSQEELSLIREGLANERRLKPLSSKVNELKSELFHARKKKPPKHEIDEIKERLRHEKSIKTLDKSSSVKYHDYPVALVGDVLRLRWNGIKPNIKKALVYLSDFTKIETDNKIESDSTGKLEGEKLDDMILDRISKGDKMDAIKLVQRHYNYDTTEAKLFVDELMSHQSIKEKTPKK